jgi:hypothetical protein
MDVSAGRTSDVRAGIPAGVMSLTIGIMELGGRGLRWTLGRSLASDRTWDLAVGAAAVAGDVGLRVVTAVRVVAEPAVRVALQPPLVPQRWRPARIVQAVARRGREERVTGGRAIERTLDVVVPAVVEQVLDRIDLNALVKQHLDVEAIVADMDLDAVVDRVDVDRVAGRLDVETVLDRIDLTSLVRERVDLDAIVAGVDVDAIAGRLDVNTVLDRIDLNAIVRERVNLDAIVAGVDIDAVAGRLDLDAVIARIDLAGLAEQVIDAVDLPEIIRDSTGSMASETVRGVRMQSIEADEAVARVLDRVFRRRRTSPPSSPDATVSADETLPIEPRAHR